MGIEKFKFIEAPLKGLVVIESKVFEDERGFFMESYNLMEFKAKGIMEVFVQDNHSHSMKEVLRGLHFQQKHPQGKLVRVIKGRVFDVAVDLRKDSDTFGKWFGIELSAENHKQFYIPSGFAHGFLTLEDETDFLYKCTDFYYPGDELGIIWNDPTINISWPTENIESIVISENDRKLPTFEEVVKCL